MTFVLAHPFRLAGSHFAVVDDAGDDGLAQEVAVIACTRLGERPLIPDYGIADPSVTGVDVADVNRALALYGPADLVVTGMRVEIVDRSTQAVVIEFDSARAAPSPDDVYYE